MIPKSKLGGFHQYKTFKARQRKLHGRQSQQLVGEQVEDALIRSLTGSAAMLHRVEHVKASLGLHGSNATYGCMHPRIEADMMMGAWTIVGVGQPPRLSDYLDGMSRFDELRQVSRFYVAVGSAISRKDNATLARHEEAKSPWPRLVRSHEPKPFHNRRNFSDPSLYIAASLTDFLVCRDASVFIGWSGSSFATLVAHSAKLRNKHARWYSACPGQMERLDRWSIGLKTAFACNTAETRNCTAAHGCYRFGTSEAVVQSSRDMSRSGWDGGPTSG